MQFMRAIVLNHMRIKLGTEYQLLPKHGRILLPAMKKRFSQEASAQSSPENFSFLKERVMELVKKFDKIDSNKVGIMFSPFPRLLLSINISFMCLYNPVNFCSFL
jgi:hypothetical protein